MNLSVENQDDRFDGKGDVSFGRHGLLFPNTIRALVCEPSNCGKANILLSLLPEPNVLRTFICGQNLCFKIDVTF